MEKGWRSVNIKKVNVKKNYMKLEKKKNNNVDANVVQLKHNNNKCYTSAFRYIYIYRYKFVFIFILYSRI